MACKPSCGSDRELFELLINNAITEAVRSGVLQGALKDCDGNALPEGTAVVLCSALASKVNALIKEGAIDVVKDVTISDGKLVVTDGTGKETKVDLPAVKSVQIVGDKLVVTEADGTKTETDIPQGTTDLAFDATTNKLTWQENGVDKSATMPYARAAVGDKEVVITTPDGASVAVPKADGALSAEDFDHTIVEGANVPGKFGVKLGTGLEAGLDGINVKLGDGLTTDAQGNIIIDQNVPPETMTSLDKGKYKAGFHTFSGLSDNTTGLPLDINSNEGEQGSSPTPVAGYDYNGYYIASTHQVDVWLQGVNNTAWYIMNDAGINADGSLADPNAWGKWQKLDNAGSVTNEMIKKMQEQINALSAGKVNKSSLVRLTDASGTVTLGYIANTNA